MFKISSIPSPRLPPMASDVGIHIQMACNLSAGARFGSVRLVIKSRIVRKPNASPGSSPEYSWTIRRWLSSGRNGRLISDPLPSATDMLTLKAAPMSEDFPEPLFPTMRILNCGFSASTCFTVEFSDLRPGRLFVGARTPDFDCPGFVGLDSERAVFLVLAADLALGLGISGNDEPDGGGSGADVFLAR